MIDTLRYTYIPLTLATIFLSTTLHAPSIASEGLEITQESTIESNELVSFGKSATYSPRYSFSITPKTDNNMEKYVGKNTPLDNIHYIPEDLIPIKNTYIDERGRKSKLRKEAAEQLWRLGEAFFSEFGTGLIVVSGYRSYSYQQQLLDRGCLPTLCAPPGHSEHQLGLAIDILEASTKEIYDTNPLYRKYYAWFKRNAHIYGYHQSYQRGAELDGYQIEPWHWRYLGVTLATQLSELGWTYGEYNEFQTYLSSK